MARDRWTTVRIPKELHERVREILDRGGNDLGYHTVSGFINEAVRLRIKELIELVPEIEPDSNDD